jgi:hypothetical protein
MPDDSPEARVPGFVLTNPGIIKFQGFRACFTGPEVKKLYLETLA